MKIGFIGLGNMGAAMAANLLRAGHEVSVWNRSGGKAAPLVHAGATAARSPAEAASAEIVITMLADDAAVESVVFREGGILSGNAGGLHVSMSTISVKLSERLLSEHGQRGQSFVAAPVFGRPAAAEAAKLFIVAGGAADLIARCEPAFSAVGQRVFHVAEEAPAANLVKLCGNFMILSAVEAMAEAMTLAEAGGVERSKLLEVLTGTLFSAPIYQTYGEILVKERFRPAGFAAPLGLKDMNLATAAAEAARVPMPLLAILRNNLLSAIAQEGEDIDCSGIARAVQRSAGKG